MGKRAFLSEFDTAQILRRYSAVTVMGLLREVAKCSDSARLDWNVVVKKLDTGISSAKECQALWRHIAYRKDLADFYPDDEQPSDDESDLEFELLPSPAVSSEANAEVVRWVKTDMQRFNIPVGGKKKGETKSKSRDAGVLADSNQGLSGGGRDGSDKAAANGSGVAAGDSSAASPPAGTACHVPLANPECTLSRAALGQSERKKRKLWSLEEDQELIAAVEKFGEGNWTNILKGSFTHERTAAQLSQRWALIRKRRDIQAAARPTSVSSAEQGNGVQTPAVDQSLRTTPAQNGGTAASVSSIVPPTTTVQNGGMDDAVAPSTTTAPIPSSSGCQTQDHASSPPTTSLSNGVNGAPNGSVPISGGMDSAALKGEVGTSTRAATNGGQRPTSGAAAAARNTAGSSTAVAAMAVGQARSTSAKSSGASVGAGRLIAPGAVVMSAAAAQAASVGQAATPPTTGALPFVPSKYIVRSNSGVPGSRGGSSKAITGPDPGVQAAAVAAGARIAPASALLKATHSGNVVHIRSGGLPVTKGLQTQAGMNGSGGSRGTSGGAIVHYITTGGGGGTPSTLLNAQRPAQQTKNQATKASSPSQTTISVTPPNGSVSPTTSNPTPPPK
ncbi:unnamed protein product [Calypogeia fissa]